MFVGELAGFESDSPCSNSCAREAVPKRIRHNPKTNADKYLFIHNLSQRFSASGATVFKNTLLRIRFKTNLTSNLKYTSPCFGMTRFITSLKNRPTGTYG